MEEKGKKNIGLIIFVVILLLACVGMGMFIFINKDKLTAKYNAKTTEKIESKEKNKVETVEEETKNEETTKEENLSSKVKCYGTYYINGNQSEGIYTLKDDGTYKVENQENSGVFVINENTITFIEMKHTTGPREEDPIYYNPKSYLISDDCSRIRLTESGSHISAYLEKVN